MIICHLELDRVVHGSWRHNTYNSHMLVNLWYICCFIWCMTKLYLHAWYISHRYINMAFSLDPFQGFNCFHMLPCRFSLSFPEFYLSNPCEHSSDNLWWWSDDILENFVWHLVRIPNVGNSLFHEQWYICSGLEIATAECVKTLGCSWTATMSKRLSIVRESQQKNISRSWTADLLCETRLTNGIFSLSTQV